MLATGRGSDNHKGYSFPSYSLIWTTRLYINDCYAEGTVLVKALYKQRGRL